MNTRYQAWINAHVPPDPTGTCAEVTQAMVAAFPELTRRRGHYRWRGMGPAERAWPHWWCTTPDLAIIDPTAAQWPDGGAGTYELHVEGSPEPTGKCPNCGEYCYNGDYLCSRTCELEYRAYIMGEGRLG